MFHLTIAVIKVGWWCWPCNERCWYAGYGVEGKYTEQTRDDEVERQSKGTLRGRENRNREQDGQALKIRKGNRISRERKVGKCTE